MARLDPHFGRIPVRLSAGGQRLRRVQQQVHQHLVELRGVDTDGGQVVVDTDGQRDPSEPGLVLDRIHRVGDRCTGLHDLDPGRAATRVPKELLDDPMDRTSSRSQRSMRSSTKAGSSRSCCSSSM